MFSFKFLEQTVNLKREDNNIANIFRQLEHKNNKILKIICLNFDLIGVLCIVEINSFFQFGNFRLVNHPVEVSNRESLTDFHCINVTSKLRSLAITDYIAQAPFNFTMFLKRRIGKSFMSVLSSLDFRMIV